MNEARKPDPTLARAASRLADDPSIPVLTERLIVATEAAAAVRRSADAPASLEPPGRRPSGDEPARAEPAAAASAPETPTAIPRSLLAPEAATDTSADLQADAPYLEETLLITDLADFDELLKSEAAPEPAPGPDLVWDDHVVLPRLAPAPAAPLQPAADFRPVISAAIEAELRSRLSRELPSLIEARLQAELARISALAAEQIAVAVAEAMSDALREAIDHAVADALRARRF